ncbi:beta-propeller fold lactonase family protein [Buchnera aphidicola]|uniref:beta-propeller fold lactonase family protein n=1 Tax=Buchnera aphidicola TaxID=9 RepID=UPI00094D57C5|nr:beta-propeller fold lactonase family protein [Buchnera aphidicola]
MKKKIFIACSGDQSIELWTLDKTFKLLKKNSILTTGTPQPLKYNKNNNLLYVGERLKNQIVTYKIYDNFQCTKIHEIAIFNTPNYISFSTDNKILFCASYHGNGFLLCKLNTGGIIQKITHVFKKIKGCHSIVMHHKHNLIFVSSLQEDRIYIYKIILDKFNKKTFALNNVTITKKNSGPRHFAFHSKSSYLYSINEFKGTIDVWRIYDANASLILIQSTHLVLKPYLHAPWASEIHIHPNGVYLYACDRANSIISFFTVHQKKGFLSYKHTYKTELQPRSFNISRDGKVLIVIGEKSNSMTVYHINVQYGYLVPKLSQSVGKNPLWVLIE